MGCHTIFYDRYIPTEQELKAKIECAKAEASELISQDDKQAEHFVRWFWLNIDNDNEYSPDAPLTGECELSEDMLQEYISSHIRHLDELRESNVLEELSTEPLSEKGIHLLLYEFSHLWNGDSLMYHEGKYYKENRKFYDKFRVFGYPHDEDDNPLVCTDPEKFISYLWKYDQDLIESWVGEKKVIGMTPQIVKWIREYWKEGEHAVRFG